MFPFVEDTTLLFDRLLKKCINFRRKKEKKNDNGQPCSCFPPFIGLIKNNVPKDAQQV